jgi:hypothetical protein
MNWTTEFPTKPGFYWLRNPMFKNWRFHNSEPRITLLEGLSFDPNYPLDIISFGTDETYNEEARWHVISGPLDLVGILSAPRFRDASVFDLPPRVAADYTSLPCHCLFRFLYRRL